MGAVSPNQRLTRAKWVALFSLALAAIGLWVWYVTQPALVLYTSPPLDNRGFRARVLVPRGWEIDERDSTISSGRLTTQDRVTIWFRPRPLPSWLSRLLYRKADAKTEMCIDVAPKLNDLGLNPANPADGSEESWISSAFFARTPCGCFRTIKAGNPSIFGDVFLGSSDKSSFDALHSAVCKSFRIE
jgi:hypothetical protein